MRCWPKSNPLQLLTRRWSCTWCIYLSAWHLPFGSPKTLHKNGRIFLVDSFLGNEGLADSVNHLLAVGFYLINIGFVTLALRYGDKATNAQTALEIISRSEE